MSPERGRGQQSGPRQADPSLVWERSSATRRRPLTREAIVAVAVSLADHEGLRAASIRRIAAELDARPMSIYSYARIRRKEELFDLMIDSVCAEALLPEIPGEWREALRAISVRLRAVLLRHRWWLDFIGSNVLIGPNGMRYREQTLAALAGLGADTSLKHAMLLAVETYVVGQAAFALDEQAQAQAGGRSGVHWRRAVEKYQHSLLDTEQFPHLARLGPLQPISAEERERCFMLGLDWLLDGISAAVRTGLGGSAPRARRGGGPRSG